MLPAASTSLLYRPRRSHHGGGDWDAPSLRLRLQAVVALLEDLRPWWQPNPFRGERPGWLDAAPELARAAAGLADAAVADLEADPAALEGWLAAYAAPLRSLPALTRLPVLAPRAGTAPVPDPARGVDRHVPGRKWAQIRAFDAVVPDTGRALVDWCAGKGHLGRTLAASRGAAVRCLERDAALCVGGVRLSGRDGTAPTFEDVDVLTSRSLLAPGEHVVALHACGALHERLVTETLDTGAAALSLAPCCYHRTAAWRPLSASGPDRPLDHDGLRLAVQETATAPRRDRRAVRRVRIHRLGFDALQRSLRGEDAYLSVPSLPSRSRGGDFAAFCRFAAERRGVTLPAHLDFDSWERIGRYREHRVRRRELVRHGFRRLIELRVVLDRALALAEGGYRVRLGTFCARALTPRNILIHAERS